MTKKINTNEIETLENEYTEDTNYSENQNNQEPKNNKRKFLKPIIIGVLSLSVVGGAGVYAYEKYETTQKAKIQEAYSKVKMNVETQSTTQNSSDDNSNNNNNTQQNPQNAKSQEEIRKIVAEAISTSEQDINFTKVKTKFEEDYAYQNNGAALYIYVVKAKANGLEYDVKIDAVSGKVLNVKIDD